MFIANLKLTNQWQKIDVANTGDEFLIQNVNNPCQYIVSSVLPDEKVVGGVLPTFSQLDFKKIDGDLYMKSNFENSSDVIHIERVE